MSSGALPSSPPSVRRSGSAGDRWLAVAAWGAIGLCSLQILLFGFGRDQGIYAVVGEAILAGKMPYRDAWDFKPPGIFLVYAFAQALFGKAMSSVRILEIAGFIGMVLAFRRLGRTLFGSALGGLLGGALAALIHTELEFWHTGQPEAFGGMLTAYALVLTTGSGSDPDRTPRRRALAWASVGALFGAAFLMKPPLGGGVLLCALALALAEWRRTGGAPSVRRAWAALAAVLVVGVGSLVPIALTAGWFAARGAWPALSWTLFQFTPGYTALGWHGTPLGLFRYGLGEAVISFSHVVPAGLALVILLPAFVSRARELRALLLVAGVVLVQVAGIALQAKFFGYHYGATLPLLAFASGIGLAKAWRLLTRFPVPGAVLWLAAVSLLVYSRLATRHVPGTFWERCGDRMSFLVRREPDREALDRKLYIAADFNLDTDRRAARAVAEMTSPRDSIFVWGFEPHIYWFAGRRPASRYLYDVPQRTHWERETARAGLLDDLARDPPRVVVVQHDDYFPYVTGDGLDSYAALETFPELRSLLEREYGEVERVDDLDLYVRR